MCTGRTHNMLAATTFVCMKQSAWCLGCGGACECAQGEHTICS
jgi:hypothetical protein